MSRELHVGEALIRVEQASNEMEDGFNAWKILYLKTLSISSRSVFLIRCLVEFSWHLVKVNLLLVKPII